MRHIVEQKGGNWVSLLAKKDVLQKCFPKTRPTEIWRVLVQPLRGQNRCIDNAKGVKIYIENMKAALRAFSQIIINRVAPKHLLKRTRRNIFWPWNAHLPSVIVLWVAPITHGLYPDDQPPHPSSTANLHPYPPLLVESASLVWKSSHDAQ